MIDHDFELPDIDIASNCKRCGKLQEDHGSRDERLVMLIYLWTRDAKVPVGEMADYVRNRAPNCQVEYSDQDRAAEASRLALEMRAR